MNTATGHTMTLGVAFDFEVDYDDEGPQSLHIRPVGSDGDWIECDLTEVGGKQWDMLEDAITEQRCYVGDRAYDESKEQP